MKRIILLISALMLFTGICAFTSSALDLNGGGNIAVNKNCSERVKYAAKTLSDYLGKITGKTFNLTTIRGIIAVSESAMVVEGGYVIRSNANYVSITGGGTRGTIYGVYAFLQEYCGCHFYTSEISEIPVNKALKVPDNINLVYKPFFEYTETDWRSPRAAEYSLANGLNGGAYRELTKQQGGTVNYISGFCHTLTTEFCSADTYFKAHPEYFAMHDDDRVPDQLCLSNNDVYDIVLQEVLTLLKEKNDPSAALQIVSLTQNDNRNYCECEKCAAIDTKNGSHSGTMIIFVNRIAKAVAQKGYDNVAIDTFAYQYTRQAPTAVRPESNVIVRLCTIECCFAHPLSDESCPQNVALMKDLSDWSKICSRIYVWDYTTNYAQTLGIFPDFGVLQNNMQTFYENGVKGVYEEGNYYIEGCDTEFGELRSYLLSKLMQNPYCDYYTEMDNFLKSYYGSGWNNIRQFIDITVDNAVCEDGHLSIYDDMSSTLSLTAEDITKCDTLWLNAERAVKDKQLENVKRSELSWRYWKACNGFAGAYSKQLFADLTAYGVTRYSESVKELNANFVYQYLSPDKWKNYTSNFTFITRDVLGLGSVALYGISLILAFALFILGIKKRKALFIILFPLMCGYTEIFMWHSRAYISWKDMLGYALTLALICALFAYLGVCAAKAKGRPKKKLLSGIICTALFAAPYGAIIYAVNVVLFDCKANKETIGIAFFVAAVELLIIMSYTLRKFTKKDEEW